ncbi:MAG: winged helix-turn-helix domain-containing protein [Candidatus Aenigmatarchaeota archaeon]
MIKILKVAKYLEENPNSYLSDIARNLNLSTGAVHRALKELQEFIITRSISQELGMNLPNLPVLIRLKEGVTFEGLVKYFAKKKKLEEITKA